MPRYVMHLRDHADEVLEPDGAETPFEAVAGNALRSVRDCMAGDVMKGRLDLRYRIHLHDENELLVHCLAVPQALEIVHAS